jgi:hypothetical protein
MEEMEREERKAVENWNGQERRHGGRKSAEAKDMPSSAE